MDPVAHVHVDEAVALTHFARAHAHEVHGALGEVDLVGRLHLQLHAMRVPQALREGGVAAEDLHVTAVVGVLLAPVLGSQDVGRIAGVRIGCRARDHAANLVILVDGMTDLHDFGARYELVMQLLVGALVRRVIPAAEKVNEREQIVNLVDGEKIRGFCTMRGSAPAR